MEKLTSEFATACVLAGGKSTRMGYDKQLLSVDDRRIFDKNYKLLKSLFETVTVVTNHSDLYEGYDVRTIADVFPSCGPLGGIHAALCDAKQEYVYFVGCDMPNISIKYIEYMQRVIARERPMACVCKKQGHIEPLNSYFSKRAIGAIEQDLRLNKCSVYYMLEKLDTHYVDEKTARLFSPDWSMFLNINTQEELDSFKKTIC